MITAVEGVLTYMLLRQRVLRGSEEVQTIQRQPIMGMPTEVPVPANKISSDIGRGLKVEVFQKIESVDSVDPIDRIFSW